MTKCGSEEKCKSCLLEKFCKLTRESWKIRTELAVGAVEIARMGMGCD